MSFSSPTGSRAGGGLPSSPPRNSNNNNSLSRTPSLKEAEDGRLMARIERNFECLRRDGRASGTLSGWGDLLRTKFKHQKAERSDLASAQSATCAAWLSGGLTGRVAMVEFLQAEKLVRQSNDPASVTSLFGLGDSILGTEWLYKHVFSRPPQAVIYETLLNCAEDALERKPENLTAQQISLALRKLALSFLPRSGESARAEAEAAVAAEEEQERERESSSNSSRTGGAGDDVKDLKDGQEDQGEVVKAAPGDQYLRIQIAMELLKLHVSSHPPPPPSSASPSSPSGTATHNTGDDDDAAAATAAHASPPQKKDATKPHRPSSPSSPSSSSAPLPREVGASLLEELGVAAAQAMGKLDGDAVVRAELLLATPEQTAADAAAAAATAASGAGNGGVGSGAGVGAGGEGGIGAGIGSDGGDELEGEGIEAVNRFLEAYVNDLTEVKQRLSHQVRWLEERGAYRLLGVEPSATEGQIKKCYHKLSLKAHPDKGGDPGAFLRLKVAYETVLKKKKRAAARVAKDEAKKRAHLEAKQAARAQAQAEAEEAMKKQKQDAAAAAAKRRASAAARSRGANSNNNGGGSGSCGGGSLKAKQMAKYGRSRARPPAPSPTTSDRARRPPPRTSTTNNRRSPGSFGVGDGGNDNEGDDEDDEDDENGDIKEASSSFDLHLSDDNDEFSRDYDDGDDDVVGNAEDHGDEDHGDANDPGGEEETWARRTHRPHQDDAEEEEARMEAEARRLHQKHEDEEEEEEEEEESWEGDGDAVDAAAAGAFPERRGGSDEDFNDDDDDDSADFFADGREEDDSLLEEKSSSEQAWAREFIRNRGSPGSSSDGRKGGGSKAPPLATTAGAGKKNRSSVLFGSSSGGLDESLDDETELLSNAFDDDDDDDDGCDLDDDGDDDDDADGDEDDGVWPSDAGLSPTMSNASTSSSSGRWEFDVSKKGPLEFSEENDGDDEDGSEQQQKQQQQQRRKRSEEGDEEEEGEEKPVFGAEFGPEFGPSFGLRGSSSSSSSSSSNNTGGGGDGGGDDNHENEEEAAATAEAATAAAAFAQRVVQQEQEEEEEELVFSASEHRARLGELETQAKAAAKKAASLAHICIQWSKVVEEVRVLTRPRGVEHLGGLINKGAFSSAVDVMEPTQEAATIVMDIVASSIEVTKETPRTMALASNMGFFQTADRVTTEGRAALSAAASAAEVNAAAVKAMGKLSTLGELAREDDEVVANKKTMGVHTALVDMLCLHFQRVAESTQSCAKQAIVAVTAATHVCALLDVMHDQAKLEAESAADEDEEDEEDQDQHPDDKRKKEEAEAEARAKAQEARAKAKKEGRGSDDDDDDDDEEGAEGKENKGRGNKKEGAEGAERSGVMPELGGVSETVDSLLGKLKDLHVQMRKRHGANLRKVNGEVLVLQRRLGECLQESSPEAMIKNTRQGQHNNNGAATAAAAATPSSPRGSGRCNGGGQGEEWRPLLCALADHVNASCLLLEDECRAHLKAQKQKQEGEVMFYSSSSMAPALAPSLGAEWWAEALERRTAWLETLAHRTEVAIAPSGRGKVLRLAAAVDPPGVRRMLGEMGGRLKALLNELAFEGHTSPGAPRHRVALDKRFSALAAPLFASGSAASPTRMSSPRR